MARQIAERPRGQAKVGLRPERRLRFLALVVSLLLSACAWLSKEPPPWRPSHHVEGGFRNPDPAFMRPGGWVRAKYFASRVWASLVSTRSLSLPRETNDGRAIRGNNTEATATWIGHSTLLVQLDGSTY